MLHVAIIGAGITGVTTAYDLLERGFSVIDRERYAAMQTSFANGGQLSVSNAEVWNHWFTVAKGLKWMLKPNASLLLNPAPSWHKYLWLAEFIGNIANYRENTVQTTRLAIAAREHLFSIAEREGIDFDHERRGILHVYWDKPSFEHASKVNSMLTEGGLERRAVTPTEMLSIEPALRQGSFYGGFFTPSDSTGDIYKFTTGLAKNSSSTPMSTASKDTKNFKSGFAGKPRQTVFVDRARSWTLMQSLCAPARTAGVWLRCSATA
jgi:D-amino-acid dehydrogenase